MTWNTASTGSNAGILMGYANVTPGATYNFSTYVRPSVATTINFVVRYYTGTNATGTLNDVSVANISAPANVWTRISAARTIPQGYNSTQLRVGMNYVAAVGDTFAADGYMVTEGSTLYNYADGNSQDWDWNGTQNNSTSTGPSL